MRFDPRPRAGLFSGTKSNRSISNAARHVFLGAGTVLAILALSPQEWVRKFGEWTKLVNEFQVPLLALLTLALTVQLVLARQPFLSRLEYILPSEYHGVPDMAPQGIQARVTGILESLGHSGDGQEHVVRIIVLTGRSTLHYLDQIVDRYSTRATWDIRILIMDPDAPGVEHLEDGAKEQILASRTLLASIKRKAVSKARPAKISWRGYSNLPMIRAFLLNEEHMFFGYFSWSRSAERWKLNEQNKKFIYARRGDELSRDSIEFFKGWFDYQWEHGRNLEGACDGTPP